jgi:diguanylate cyclase (GGDEF)-like protein/PAS domain S-box-containing protein
MVSRELGVAVHDLMYWRDVFLEGGSKSLKDRLTFPGEREVGTVQRDIGEPRGSEPGGQELAELLPVTVFETDAEGRITFVNQTGLSTFGYSQGDIEEGLSAFQVLAPAQHDKAARDISRILRGEELPPQEYTALRKDGSTFSVLIHASPVIREDRAAGLRGIVLDITERERAEARLHDSERKYRQLFENLNDAALLADAETGIILDANRQAEGLLGRTRDEIIGKHQSELHPTAESDKYRRMFAEHVQQGRAVEFDAEVVRQDGRIVPVAISAATMATSGKPAILGLFRDITKLKKAEEIVRRHAYYDALTGLPNRVLFQDGLGVALAEARRHHHMVAVLFLDLDRLKLVNDSFGHAQGDKVLRQAGQRLKNALRPGDIAARLGGDEFAASLGGLGSSGDAAAVAWRVLEALRSPFIIDGAEVHVTVSIGISLYPSDGDEPESLLKKADAAMYEAKEQGRNRLQFHMVGLMEEARHRLALENDLRHAVERGELVLHYQPQVEIETGRIIAVEALLRWRHPQRGMLAPADFIGVAEESGLIDAIGEWVLRNACAQAKAWQSERVCDPAPRVAVNLSAREFRREGLADVVSACLAEAGLDPRFLELEISESAVTRNVERSIAIMRKLKQQGIHLALDDFGLGHCSLIDLKRLPADALKIDQSFTRDVTSDENSQAIVEAIIAMARTLRLRIVGEGVERQDQLAFLRERHCYAMQGHLHSKPCSAEALAELLVTPRPCVVVEQT